MKALTIHQPWAWAIAAGHKRIENRTWGTAYRGPILIHAGRSRNSLDAGRAFIERLGLDVPLTHLLAFGSIVAVAMLDRCLPVSAVSDDPFAEGPICWMLSDVRAVRPIPLNGAQGLFYVPDQIASRLVEIESPLPDWTPGVLPLH